MKKNRLKKSQELFEIAMTLYPDGVQKSRHPNYFVDNYPIFIERGCGSHIYDVDENEYIDWALSYGPLVLGHCYSRVDQAVIEEINKGFLFNLTNSVQLTLAKKLIDIIPCAEQAIFLNSGSDATTAAVRIARIYTGRKKIIRWGYHGWHDWCVGGEGVPKGITGDILTFEYNNLDSLQKVLEKNKNEIACIIMMPLSVELPEPGFLNGVRELATTHGAVLIFDEVRSWPRMGLGGAQEYYGVTPDMTTLSKGMANGYTISSVVGKKEIMDAVGKTRISGTFFSNSLGMAAALATIQELEETHAIDHMWRIGKQLSSGLRNLIKDMNIKAQVIGIPPMGYLLLGQIQDYARLKGGGVPVDEESAGLMKSFYSETIKGGVFLHPRHHWFTCLSHTDDDVRITLQVAEQVFNFIKRAG